MIEKDLTERAERALAAEGAQWAVVNFSGRDVVLTGNATDENEPGEAVAVLRSLWGVGKVRNKAGLPPEAEPFDWSARRRGKSIRLYGHYPNRAMRQTIIGMTKAALPGFEVVDRMRVARGVPPTDTWLAGLSFAVKQLASLKRGRVRLMDLTLTIEGEAESSQAYRTVSAALKGGLPKGITLAAAEIRAPVVSPYTWSAQFAGGQLVLSGHVASEDAREEVLAAARTAAVGTGVVDHMEPARGAPKHWADAAAALIKQMLRLQSGSAEMKDAEVVVGGVAADEARARAVRESLRASLPSEFKLTDKIRVREPKVEAKPPAGLPPPQAVPKSAESTTSKSPEQTAAKSPETTSKPAEQASKPAEQASKPAEQAAAKPAEQTASKPAEQTASKPAEQTASKPAEQAAAKPAEQTASKPAEQAASKPAEETLSKSAEETVSKSVQEAATALLGSPGGAPQPPAKGASKAATPATEAAPKVAAAHPPPADLAACRSELSTLASANPIMFERGLAVIEDAGREALSRIAAAVKACPGVRIGAEGHADIEGSAEHNERLSVKRAEVVADFLIDAGVAAERLETAGFGTSRPAAPNTTPQTRAKNRRTEIVVRP